MINDKLFNKFCREIYNKHPQGKGIFKFSFFKEKYYDELILGYEFLTE